MMKTLVRLGSAAAALAASAILLSKPAMAQTANSELEGGPGAARAAAPQALAPQEYRDWRDDRDWRADRDWRDDDWRYDRVRPDFQLVQEECSRAAIEEAWRRNFYSAQYNGGPRLVAGPRGFELRGQVRLHDRSGFHYADSVCEWDRGRVGYFRFLRD